MEGIREFCMIFASSLESYRYYRIKRLFIRPLRENLRGQSQINDLHCYMA